MNILKLLVVLFFINLSGVFSQISINNPVSDGKSLRLQVYYFHATSRCPTCLSIEDNARKLLETDFKKEMDNGVIKFTVLNSDEDENKQLCKKYNAFGSSLHLVKISNGKESDVDLTNFAFECSLDNTAKFMKDLKEKITEMLK